MAFSDLTLKIMTERANIVSHQNLAKLNLFSHTYSELDGTFGGALAVPMYDLSAATIFNSSTNNYATSESIGGALINLDKHLVKSVSITDPEESFSSVHFAGDTAEALADSLTRGINKVFFDQLSSESITLSADVTLTSKSGIANLVEVAYANDLPIDSTVVVLTPSAFAGVLAQLDSSVFGGYEPIQYGLVKNLYGFAGFVCSPLIPSELSATGFLIQRDAIGVVSKYLPSFAEGTYSQTWKATNEDGLTIGYRLFGDASLGCNRLAADILFGTKILNPNKIVKLM